MGQQGKQVTKLVLANFVARTKRGGLKLFEGAKNISTAHAAGQRQKRTPD